MITPDEARQFAQKHFPNAPEKLIEELGIELNESELSGCDGWCLSLGDTAIIRLNSKLGVGRRRFTLAHELSHLILGIPGVIGETYEQMLSSSLEEERQVNELASELLLPTTIVRQLIPDVPVVFGALKRLAKKANVSELAAAIRVCNLSQELGLINSSVVFFSSGTAVSWQWSTTFKMPEDRAISLLESARGSSPDVFRFKRTDGQVIVASIIENPNFGSATLFVQLLPEELGLQTSQHEHRKKLENELFAGNVKLQQRMSGFFGAHKGRIASMTLKQAIEDFWNRYESQLKSTPVNSSLGREYVELRIKEWF